MTQYALCIGINDYPGTGSDLAGCVNDANDWAKVLKGRGFKVAQLLDRQATGKAMRAAIKATLAGARSGDFVLVQYSGHGSFVDDVDGDEADGTDECLCPYDVHSRGPITDDELFELYSARARGVKLLMISDSCHSGSVAKFAPITTPPTIKGARAAEKSAVPPAHRVLVQSAAGETGHAPRHAHVQPARTLRGLAHVGLSGCRIQLRRLFSGQAQRRIHLHRTARACQFEEKRKLCGLVQCDT